MKLVLRAACRVEGGEEEKEEKKALFYALRMKMHFTCFQLLNMVLKQKLFLCYLFFSYFAFVRLFMRRFFCCGTCTYGVVMLLLLFFRLLQAVRVHSYSLRWQNSFVTKWKFGQTLKKPSHQAQNMNNLNLIKCCSYFYIS